MASVDDLFKNSGIPSKRKLEPIKDPSEIYKSTKSSVGDEIRRARVKDTNEGENGLTSIVRGAEGEDFGPEMPPEDDDEQGRFFGGGISHKESQILDYVESADAGRAEETIDIGWLRKTAINFEKRINKNTQLRAKFESEPQNFIESEADLDADIKALSVLSEQPELYVEFVRLGCAASLVGLLSHDNTDIAIDVIEIIRELTDEDILASDEQWDILVDAFTEADLLGLLISNFSRLNEDDESDRNGVYHALGVIENLCSRTQMAVRVGQNKSLLEWLLRRIQRSEVSVTQNKQYATEILAILTQTTPENRLRTIQLDAVDIVLQLIAPYRKRDPGKGTEEEEYMSNLFEALVCLVDEPEGKIKFKESEGIELCLLILKDGKKSREPALRLLDHAVGGSISCELCNQLVEAGGLKATFTLFMKTQDQRLLGHLLAIFATMLRVLPATSAARIRTLTKFVEKDYEKITKLVFLHLDYNTQIRRAGVESNTGQQKTQQAKDDWELERLTKRLDAGLYTLQTIDVILAWLVAEDRGTRRRIKQLLGEHQQSLADLQDTLQEQMDGLDTAEPDGKNMKEILGALIVFLK